MISRLTQSTKILTSVLCSVILLAAPLPKCAPAMADDQLKLAASIPVLNTTALTPGAKEAATLLGILPKVERLQQLKQQNGNSEQINDEELGLKVDVLDKVMGGALEIQMVTGRIDREVAWAYAGHDMLLAKRQKIMNYLFTANFMQGGVLGVLSGPFFLHGENTLGKEFLLLASSIGLALSMASFVEARSGSKRVDGGTTVLADVFHLAQPTLPMHQADIVSKYMNSVPPGSTTNRTRIDALVDSWKQGHYLKSTNEKLLQRLSAIEPEGSKYKENVGLLNQRLRMLFDTQSAIEQLHGDLLELLRAAEIS